MKTKAPMIVGLLYSQQVIRCRKVKLTACSTMRAWLSAGGQRIEVRLEPDGRGEITVLGPDGRRLQRLEIPAAV